MAPTDRIEAIDALRGFALIGILFYNIIGMGGPLDADIPTAAPSLHHPDWQVWWTSQLLVHGAMRGLFSLLFGASALLFLRSGGRDAAFLRRCAWLFVFGLINCTLLLWPGDILLIYALAGPVVLLFARATARQQGIAGMALLVVLAILPFLSAGSDPASTAADTAAAAARTAEAAAEQSARLGTYGQTLAYMTQVSIDWTWSLATAWWVLDAAGFMLIGMALLNVGLLDGTASRRIYGLLALIGFGLGLPLRGWETALAYMNGGEAGTLASATFEFSRLLLTLGWLGGFMLAWNASRGTRPGWVASLLSALGRTALSGYLAQSILAAILFSGFGLGLWNRLSWPGMWALVPLMMLGIGLCAMGWLARYSMGPVEWLWRGLVFGRFPALRRP